MGHKTSPIAFRIPLILPWRSRWFEKQRRYGAVLKEDVLLRDFLRTRLKHAAVESIEIERSPQQLTLIIATSRPGVVIGRGGEEVEKLQKDLMQLLRRLRSLKSPKELPRVKLDIREVRAPESSAALVSQRMAQELEKRMPFRRVLRQTLERLTQEKKVEGARVEVSGRLDGAEMSRRQWLGRGRLPLQKLRADIDFARATAYCPYGTIGVKVWIYKGEKFQ